MAETTFARWYYPPGRPLEEGRVFTDPNLVPHGWSVDPSPPADGADPLAPVISPADYDAAIRAAADANEKLARAETRIAELEAELASKPSKKSKAPPADADSQAQ